MTADILPPPPTAESMGAPLRAGLQETEQPADYCMRIKGRAQRSARTWFVCHLRLAPHSRKCCDRRFLLGNRRSQRQPCHSPPPPTAESQGRPCGRIGMIKQPSQRHCTLCFLFLKKAGEHGARPFLVRLPFFTLFRVKKCWPRVRQRSVRGAGPENERIISLLRPRRNQREHLCRWIYKKIEQPGCLLSIRIYKCQKWGGQRPTPVPGSRGTCRVLMDMTGNHDLVTT